jgi:hypothetical protein
MGHDLPRALWPDIVDRIAGLVQRAEDERAATWTPPARRS